MDGCVLTGTSIWPMLLVVILAILVYYCTQHKEDILAMLQRWDRFLFSPWLVYSAGRIISVASVIEEILDLGQLHYSLKDKQYSKRHWALLCFVVKRVMYSCCRSFCKLMAASDRHMWQCFFMLHLWIARWSPQESNIESSETILFWYAKQFIMYA
jgi:hypothetical protein